MNKILLGIIALAILATGCTKEQFEINGGERGNPDGSIAFYPSEKVMVQTRGIPQTSLGAYTRIDAIMTDKNGTNTSIKLSKPKNVTSPWTSNPALLWPKDAKLSFAAYAIDTISGGKGTYSDAGIVYSSATGTPGKITYTVPTDVKMQPDLLVAAVAAQTKPDNAVVDMEMQHALACVSFCATSTTFNYIKSIRITGVAASGTYKLGTTLDQTAWDITGASRTIQFAAGMNGSEIQASSKDLNYLMNPDGYLMMVPQDLSGSRAQIEVVYLNADKKTEETLTYLIPENAVWLPGKKYVYVMDEGAPIGAVAYWEHYDDDTFGLYYVNGYEIVDGISNGKNIINAGYGLLVPEIYQSYYKAQSIQMGVGGNKYEIASIYTYKEDNIVATGVNFGTTNRPLDCVLFTLSQNNYPFGHTNAGGICPSATNTPESISATIYDTEHKADITITTYGKCLPHYARGVYTSRSAIPSAHYIRTPMQMRNISYQTQPADYTGTNYTTDNTYVQEFDAMDYGSQDGVRGIDVAGSAPFYEAIVQGIFNGTFDGRNIYTKTGIGRRTTADYATIDNLTITAAAPPSIKYWGHSTVSLFEVNAGSILNLYNTPKCSISADNTYSINVAGFVGFNIGTFANITNWASLSNISTKLSGPDAGWLSPITGGIVGWNGNPSGIVSNCTNRGEISGATYVGGVVALNNYNGVINHCKNHGTIYSTSTSTDKDGVLVDRCIGGIVGIQMCGDNPTTDNTFQPTISNCQNYSDNIGNNNIGSYASNVGGIVGLNDWNWASAGTTIPSTVFGRVTLCINYGNVTNNNGSKANGVGGIAGVNNGNIDHCQGKGAITGSETVSAGGIAGYSVGNVTDCIYYNSDKVNCQIISSNGAGVEDGAAGGIVGYLARSQEYYAESGMINRCLFLAVAPITNDGSPAPAAGFMSREYLYRFPTGGSSFYVNMTQDGRVLDQPLYTINNVFMLTGDNYNYNPDFPFYQSSTADALTYGPFVDGYYTVGILRLSSDQFKTIPFNGWKDYGWIKPSSGKYPYVVPGTEDDLSVIPLVSGSEDGFQSSLYNMVDAIRNSNGTADIAFSPSTPVVNSLRFDFSDINPEYIANVTSIVITCSDTFSGNGSATFKAPAGWSISATGYTPYDVGGKYGAYIRITGSTTITMTNTKAKRR